MVKKKAPREVTAYTHQQPATPPAPDDRPQIPDMKPGPYYVTVIDAGRVGYLSGPYDNHEDALAAVEHCRTIAVRHNRQAHFYGFGTARIKDASHPQYNKPGLFQKWGYPLVDGKSDDLAPECPDEMLED